MFINYSKKYIYLRVPKTGSTSFQHQLIEDYDKNDEVSYTQIIYSDIRGKNWFHAHSYSFHPYNPHLTLPELKTLGIDVEKFDIYATLRNPVDRFLSRAYHMDYYVDGDKERLKKPEKNINKNKLVEKYLNYLSNNPGELTYNHMWRQQSAWLVYKQKEIDRLFLYEELPEMMNELTGNESMRYRFRTEPREDKTWSGVDDNLIEGIRNYYDDDFHLYEKYCKTRIKQQ